MEIVYEKPPIYEKLAKAFNIEDNSAIVFTYGNKLYVPGGRKLNIDKPLLRHEETHARQQKLIGIDEWWDRFLENPAFRLEQELEAYREQYRAMWDLTPESRDGYLNHLAGDLSGEMYGSLMTLNEAKVIITQGIVLKRPKIAGGNNDRKAKKLKRQNKKRGRK